MIHKSQETQVCMYTETDIVIIIVEVIALCCESLKYKNCVWVNLSAILKSPKKFPFISPPSLAE